MPPGALSRLWTRILTGDGLRKTRLHTYSGNRIDLGGLAYLPRSIWSVALLKIFGYRQRVPWLGYRAVKHLGLVIQPDWKVLEFGSGMSSLFFARRCRELVSVESEPAWYERMERLFAQKGITNIDYRLRDSESYTAHPDLADHSFDLVVVDGLRRDRTAKFALQKVKPGGYVFLDNSDVPLAEFEAARRVLIEATDPKDILFINDFYPFLLQVNESMFVKIGEEIPGVDSINTAMLTKTSSA